MAIALVTSGKQHTSTGSSSTVTIPLTVSGSDTALLVFATSVNSGDKLLGGSATWNGSSMGSPIATITTPLGNHYTYCWMIVAPAAGSFNVVVTANSNAVFCAGAVVLSGVDQSTPYTTTAGVGNATPSSPFSSSITVPTDGWAVDWFGARANGATIAPDGSQTQIGSPVTIDFNGQYGASYKSNATAMAWTYTGSPSVTHMVVAVQAAAGGDTTAPVLTSPTGTQTGSSTATVGATTDEGNGTMYAVVTLSATPPSVAQVQAGQNSAGSAAAWAGNQAISSTGAKTFSATGLTASTTYYAHIQHRDAASNDSTVVTSASFTTAAAAASDIAARVARRGLSGIHSFGLRR